MGAGRFGEPRATLRPSAGPRLCRSLSVSGPWRAQVCQLGLHGTGPGQEVHGSLTSARAAGPDAPGTAVVNILWKLREASEAESPPIVSPYELGPGRCSELWESLALSWFGTEGSVLPHTS